MIKHEEEFFSIKKPVYKKCDRCGLEVTQEDSMEFQEFLHIDYIGGYGSIFGDASNIQGDFCQHCVKKLFGNYLRIED